AAIMLSFVLIAKASAKRVNIFNVIAVAAFILLISNPFNITNVGFQLSFIAVSGLIYLQPKINSLYQPKNKIITFLWSIIAVSIAAQVATAPISLYYFHQFPVYFIISNLFIVVPATLIMYLGIALLIFSGLEPLAKILGYLLNQLIDFTNNGLFLIEQINHANIKQIWWSVATIALCYAILILFLKSNKNKYYLKFAFALFGIFIFKMSDDEFKHIRQKQVAFFSLRKNTAVAFIKGRNATLITDLDVNDYTYLFSVKPYLDSCHVQYIKYVNPHLNVGEKLFSFAGKQLKIINHKNNNFNASKADWLLLSGDKIYDLDRVLYSNKVKVLFIDGKNRDFVIDDFKQQLGKHQQPYHVLKRDYAVEIKLE
ncbi:MAG: ComEC/Rec2 family competence protein, partial [Pelobium sp.]